MSGSGSPAAKAGSGGHTPSWEMAGLELSDQRISKKADIIKMGGIGTIYGGTGDPGAAKKPGGFVPTGSPHHPGALDRRVSGSYKPHGAPRMTMMADTQPKKVPTKPAPYEPAQLATDGVTRNAKGKNEPKYAVKDPNTKTLTVESRDGTKFPFQVSARPTETHTKPVKVGGKTYFISEKDSPNLEFVQHLFAQKGSPPRMRVA